MSTLNKLLSLKQNKVKAGFITILFVSLLSVSVLKDSQANLAGLSGKTYQLSSPILVRSSDNQQKVFLIDEKSNKRAFIDTEVFEQCGLSYTDIQTVHPILLKCCAETKPITNAQNCKQIVNAVKAKGIEEGNNNLLLTELNQYMRQANNKLPNIETLSQIINRPNLNNPFSQEKLTESNLVRVLRSQSQQQNVYLVDKNGQRRKFSNAQVFQNCGLDFKKIETLSEQIINEIPLGKNIENTEQCQAILATIGNRKLVKELASLIEQSEPESFVLVKQPLLIRSKKNQQNVYLVDAKGKKRQFANSDLFVSCGLSFNAIQTIEDELLKSRNNGNKINSVESCKQILVDLESFVLKDRLIAKQPTIPNKPPENRVGILPVLPILKPSIPGVLPPVNSIDDGSGERGDPEDNVSPIVDEQTEEVPEALTLADLVPDLSLPSSIKNGVVEVVQGDVESDYFEGSLKLNGLQTKVVKYVPENGTQANLILSQSAMKVVDFIPDLRDTEFADYGEFKKTLFMFVADSNKDLLPTKTTQASIENFINRDDFTDIAPQVGMQFVATLDLTQHPEAELLANAMGMKSTNIVVDLPIDERFFNNVKPINQPAEPLFTDETRTLADLQGVYGTEFIQQAKFRANADYLLNKRIGPSKITRAQWELSIGTEQSVALNVDLDIPLVVADTKLEATEVQIKADKTANLISLEGSVKRADANNIMSLPQLELTTSLFSGEYSVPEDLTKRVGEEGGSLQITGLAKLASARTKTSDVNYELALELSENGDAVEPTLTITGGYSLADILQGVASNIPDIELNKIQVSANHLAGIVSLYGLPVQAVYYKTPEMNQPIVGLHHQELDLVSYIPKIKETNLGSFGLANVVMFARPESETNDITFADKTEVPEPLAQMLARKGVAEEDLYPLVIRPGVNLIGQYGRGQVSDEGQAATVMDAYGVEQSSQTDEAAKVYLVKANFKASALRNANYKRYLDDGKQAVRSVTAKQVACGLVSAADKADLSGLDLQISLPEFSPPYAGDAVRFSNSQFSLKEIDSQIEPSIITVMTMRLPEAQAGIKELAMGTKLRVKGELNQLCEGVNSQSNIEVGFAGSTAINLENIADLSFEALKKVTELNANDENSEDTQEKTGAQASLASVDSESDAKAFKQKLAKDKDLGWKKPFGIPFLNIKRFASSGTFAQSDGNVQIVNSIWTESVLGSATIDVLGSMTLESGQNEQEFSVEDWLFRLGKPVKLVDLPGMSKIAQTYPLIKLGDFTVNQLDLTPDEMTGKISSDARSLEGDFALYINEDAAQNNDIQFYAGVNRFNANMLLKKPLPGLVGDLTLGKTAFSIQTGSNPSLKIAELPEAAANIFNSAVGEVLQTDTLIPQQKGITIAGRLNPAEIPNKAELNSLKGMLSLVGMKSPIPVVGSLIEATNEGSNANDVSGNSPSSSSSSNGQFKASLDAFIPNFNLPSIDKEKLIFTQNSISLSDLDATKVALNSKMQFTPPTPIQGTLGKSMELDGRLEYSAESSTNYRFNATGQSALNWKEPLGFKGLLFENIGIEVSNSKQESQQNSALTLIADATLYGLAVKARYSLDSSSSNSSAVSSSGNSTSQLIELVAKEEGDLIDLDTVLSSLNLLPGSANYLNISQYFNLKAKGLLLSQESSTAQVTFAAEDVSGEINVPQPLSQADIDDKKTPSKPLTFSGQLAVSGFNSAKPSLFLKNDSAIVLKDIIPEKVGVGPLASLGIPNGLIMLSADTGNLSVSEINQRIYDKVFADLLGEKGAASVIFMRSGLTVLVRSNLKQVLPEQFGSIVSWLPTSGEVILGGGVENRGGVFNLGFYANIRDFTLNVPSPFDTFVDSAGGNVYFYIKTIGEKAAGAETGLQTGMKMNLPRLDNPSNLQKVNATLKLAATVIPGASPDLTVGVKVPNKWDNPLGIEDISLTNTEVDIGVAGNGTVFSLNTEQARFKDKTFVMDLDSAWAGAVPTQLAVQFAKAPSHQGDFVITPLLQAQLYNSLFKVAARGGSALADNIRQQLDNEIVMLDSGVINSKALFNQFSNVLSGASAASDVMSDVLENSPLAWIGIKDPEIFFVTPGNNLPPREGVERPPLGFGLLARGELVLDIGDLDISIANGEYKINLVDGYFAKGNITPPSPFSDTNLSVLGKQSIISMTPSALRVDGSFKLPGTFIPGVPAEARGSFAFSRKEGVSNGVHIDADIEVADYGISRAASIDLVDNTFKVYSVPNGCVDLPIKFDGNITASLPPSASDAEKLLTIAKFTAPSIDPISCTKDLVEMWANYAKEWIDDPSKALKNPLAAQQAMFDASKTALGLVPDNPATRELYKGIETIESVLPPIPSVPGAGEAGKLVGQGLDEVTDLAKKIPGAGEASKLAGQAANEVKKRVSQAVSNVAGNASKAATAAADVAMQGINLGGQVVSDIKSAVFGSGKNWCNARIEALRTQNLEINKAKALEMEQALTSMWTVGKEAEAILPFMEQAKSKVTSTQETFFSFSKEWNKLAQELFTPGVQKEYYVDHVFKYHNAGKGWRDGRPQDQQDTWYYNRTVDSILRNNIARSVTKNWDSKNVGDYLAQFKAWHEKSNFHPDADYPGFRCEKTFAMQNFFFAGINLLFFHRPNNIVVTDTLKNHEYGNIINGAKDLAPAYADTNQIALRYLQDYQVLAAERNIAFIADLRAKMQGAINVVKVRYIDDAAKFADLTPAFEQAEKALDNFYQRALQLSEKGSDSVKNQRLQGLFKTANKKISDIYLAEANLDLDAVNQPWNSTKELPVIALPYADKCLTSFYRPMENDNPLKVMNCHDKLAKALQDIKNGKVDSINKGTTLLQQAWGNFDGDVRVVEDRRFQFKLWEAEYGAYRLSTAVSEQSPVADYCLGVPKLFTKTESNIPVQVQPCLENDFGQLWTKVSDAGGPAFFKLQSVEYGLCATWSGVSGVNSLVLKTCNDRHTDNQVMSALWPLRDSERAEPKVLPADIERRFVWKNIGNGRCLNVQETNENGLLTVNAYNSDDWKCNQIKPSGSSVESFNFSMENESDNKWRFVTEVNGEKACLISSNEFVDYFAFKETTVGKNSKRTVGLGSCESFKTLWEILPSGSNYEPTLASKKYKIREAYGEKQCMNVTETTTYPALVKLPVTLNNCSDSFRQSNELFNVIEVDSNFDSANNLKVKQWYQDELNTMGTIEGQVVVLDIDGVSEMPAVGIQMTLVKSGSSAIIAQSVTDKDGQFMFDSIPQGDYWVNQKLPQHISALSDSYAAADSKVFASVKANSISNGHKFINREGVSITGRVVLKEAGEFIFIDKKIVTLIDRTTKKVVRETITDDKGLYKFEFVRAGKYEIVIDPEEYSVYKESNYRYPRPSYVRLDSLDGRQQQNISVNSIWDRDFVLEKSP